MEQVPGEAVYLISDQRVTALHGEQVARIAPLLDGTRRLEEVVRDASDALPAEQATRLLSRLAAAGLLSERAPGPLSAGQAYWEAAGLDGAAATAALSTAAVHAAAVGGVQSEGLHAALAAAGLRTVPAGRSAAADLTVVLCDDYLQPDLERVDAAHRAAGRPWLPVKTNGTEVWIGPFLGSADGPCWSCLADRLWRGRPAEAHVQHMLRRSGPVPRATCSLPAAQQAGLQLAVLEASKWLAGHRHPGQAALWTLDGLTLEGGHHPVARRPQCAACGDPGLTAARALAPVVLSSRPKQETDGGGHRALTAQQLLDRYGHLVDPVTGLVKEIRQDPRGPAFLNSFHAGHNPVGDPRGLGSVRAGLRSTSGGKGATALQARAGALAEALERHSGYLQGGEPVVRGSLRSLGDRALSPDAVQLYDPRQFPGREAWNAEHGPFHQVCDPFDPDDEIDWSPVWSLTGQRQRLLPTALLYYNVPQPAGRFYCAANSNGNAAGGSLEDAVLQGFLELVERDALALWWYNRTRQPGVDLEAFGDPWTAELRRVHRDLGREVWALDLTSDLGIPVMAALSRRTDKPQEDIVLGFGAHFDPGLALRRALTEVNQLLPYVVEARADGTGYGTSDPETLSWMRTATAAGLPYLLPDPAEPAVRPGHHPYTPRTDLRDDLAAAEELVRSHGMELLVLDQTRPDVGLPVVKVIVPGLRPHWSRFAPGRLFDVPAALGRTAGPTRYEDLNPVPFFL
ncbi:TOMM precursor leader peptide-binding protein [Streptacidiphilus sp. ASG 303]|uniref:TOMM precursor leader peptide-binding protein n=1 Tax=Streptacidiphilus sp. ASG 303 TaxID=2896847 RepID=UPI001E295917|nr:TOMM precursor leader peptide-binding protein [Streptacidiphilus sp. ASG 303]MCD0486336.1 TOMM precursor leader peptide-binding protein [Streptacidiphilus sp. ASG 303]